MSTMALLQDGQTMLLDPAIRNWVLIPIMIVMVLVGVLRHQITILLGGEQKSSNLKAVRETKALLRGMILRQSGDNIPPASFHARRRYLCDEYAKGTYLKNPEAASQGAANPMADPQNMEMMMEGMKKNMAMIIPQTLIMGWINFFFSGFVLIKLPFPLTVRFKGMLQRGIETADMDVTWVSSLSWYFLNLFGLRGVFSMILGEENAADGMRDMQAMGSMGMMAGASPGGQAAPGQPQDMPKIFNAEKENLELTPHEWILTGVEERVLKKYGRAVNKSSSGVGGDAKRKAKRM
ncbi:uncharacterized protein VTP21DRAFT_5067 [Calcarisporiella thermophila]|uniref:uncharacterized protein n=1 Tax=Calcarisporiella thermophila TaxID=911321 RepID=UPI00374293B3